MAQRISRAKQRIRDSGASFRLPPDAERSDRLGVVLQVLYLLFNEGYTAMAGPDLMRPDLTAEAVRLTRDLLRLVPDDGEVAGLLALMLLVDARRPPAPAPTVRSCRSPSRTAHTGTAQPSPRESPSSPRRWPASRSARTSCRLPSPPCTTRHRRQQDTDWPQILELYRLLEQMVPGPTVTLNRAVAEAMVHGPRAGLDLLETVAVDNRVSGAHRFDAVRAHLLEIAGERAKPVRATSAPPAEPRASRSAATCSPAPGAPTGRARTSQTT